MFVPVDQSLLGAVVTRSMKKQVAHGETEMTAAPSTVEKKTDSSPLNQGKSGIPQSLTNSFNSKQFDLQHIRLEQFKDSSIQQKIKKFNEIQPKVHLFFTMVYYIN